MKARRCIVPADGFYEWLARREGQAAILLRSQRWSAVRLRGIVGWKGAAGMVMETRSIRTTTPNTIASAIHDRMPVILNPGAYHLWLDPGFADVAAVSELLKPYDALLMMRRYPVSAPVNCVSNDGEPCSAPADPIPTQDRLFM
jgi:putative SOS response-associated peptidase YedK